MKKDRFFLECCLTLRAKSGEKGRIRGKCGDYSQNTIHSTMSTDALFSGQSDYALDEKGRLTVQRDWRLKGVDSETLHLVPDSKGACLRVMRPDRFAKFAEDVRLEPGMDSRKHRNFLRDFFSNSTAVSTDKQGRIMIPKEYCERLKLKGTVRVLGCYDLFEVWNKEAFAKHHATERDEYHHFAGALGL